MLTYVSKTCKAAELAEAQPVEKNPEANAAAKCLHFDMVEPKVFL